MVAPQAVTRHGARISVGLRSRLPKRSWSTRHVLVRASLHETLFNKARCASAVALASAFLGCSPMPVDASTHLVQAPLATTPELVETQRTMIQAWDIIRGNYVDPTFNHLDWERDLKEHLSKVASLSSAEEGEQELKELVGDLGDAYTRWIPKKQYREFLVDSIDGEVQGVGLLIASDPVSGRHLVLSPIQGGPAALAGIQKGDEIVRVNGEEVGSSADIGMALRGKQGSSVELEIARQVPGEVSNRMSEDVRLERKKFRLKRQRVAMSPVFATAIHTDDDKVVGYIRALNFSKVLSTDMAKAIKQLAKEGSEGYILDLRNNPGGLVTSALDVAGLFLNSQDHPTIFSISGRGPEGHGRDVQKVKLEGEGRALSGAPLTVLVNNQSASASEILAGALKDNKRAAVIGDTKTFGKAKIQSVFELADGSGLFVTVARYLTPAGVDINQKGIEPNVSCATTGIPTSHRALHSSIPVAPGLVGGDPSVLNEIETDPCVLTALELELNANRGHM
jgi:carboxyl-terminal processing protease